MTTFVIQKTQELSFALLRVAAHIRRFELRQRIERLSYHLIENVAYQNPEMSISTIEAIRHFVLLGKNIYEIEPNNARILDRELEHLANEVRRFSGTSELPNLESFFTARLPIHREKSVPQPTEVVISEKEVDQAVQEISESGNEESGNQEDASSGIRKEKIFVMLSTAPEKRLSLREIVSAFPEVSDRTIRNDLRKLSEDGRVIRQGSGGPSNYYKAM